MILVFCAAISIIALFSSCVVLCGDAYAELPEDLMTNNDHVFLGMLKSVDTLVNFGELDYLGKKSIALLIEYRFTSVEVFKGNQNNVDLFLWNCVITSLSDDGVSGSDFSDSLPELIYGCNISKGHEVIYSLTPEVIVPIDELLTLFSDAGSRTDWAARKGDSIIAARLFASKELIHFLNKQNHLGQVIYGTDKSLMTSYLYRINEIGCCTDAGPKDIESSEYLDELRSFANKIL